MDTLQNAHILSADHRPIVEDFLTRMRAVQEQLREAQTKLSEIVNAAPVEIRVLEHDIKAVHVVDSTDLNNMLNSVIGACRMAQMEMPSSKEFVGKFNSLSKPRRSRRLAAKPRKSYVEM